LSLTRRFLAVALVALAITTLLSVRWVSERIESATLQSRAQSAAVFMRTFVEPLAQDLARGKELDPSSKNALDQLLTSSPLSNQVLILRIWHADGSLAFSSERDEPSAAPPATEEIDTAFKGQIFVELQDAHHDQAALERKHNVRLFEVNAPLYQTGTRRVIAAAQFYENASKLHSDLAAARAQSWILSGLLTLAMIAALYRVVQGANSVIEQQRQVIGERDAEAVRLASQNEDLRKRVETAHRRGMEHNERFLRRVGSDLHDGPAQHLALVLLRLDELVPYFPHSSEDEFRAAREVLEAIRRSTGDALREIRNISAGLSLPELQRISPADALEIAARAHERATGTRVERAIGTLPPHLPLPMTICLFRFAQEGLNNAFRHAAGKGQRLTALSDDTKILIELSDSGSGFNVDAWQQRNDRLGLYGLKHRVESLGGTFEIDSEVGRGTRLRVNFPNKSVRGIRV
jgi:signal transduction histidine kinase